MKILFVSSVLPYPLHSGGQVRIYNLLKRLSKKHEITLFSFIRSEDERVHLTNLSFCHTVTTILRGHAWQPAYVLRSLGSTYPFLYTTYNNRFMKDAIEKELAGGSYDLVHIEPGYVWPSIPKLDIPLVVSEHNIEHEIYTSYVASFPVVAIRPFLSLDVGKMIRWERKIWNIANHVIAVSNEDKKYMSDYVDSKKVSLVPNGVDLPSFPFLPKKKSNDNAMIFLFVGNFSWIQNRDALKYLLQDIWPTILKKYSKAKLRIVGKHISSSLLSLIDTDHTSLLEFVDSIQGELQSADVLLAPIRIGGGTKYKILEAQASGLPVITTTLGAQGMGLVNGKHILIADTLPDVLHAIEILMDEKSRTLLVKAARSHIEEHYSWDTIAQSLEQAWQEANEQNR